MRAAIAVAMVIATLPGAGTATIPEAVPDLPVLGAQAYRGNDLIATPTGVILPTAKSADGDITDWIGTPTRFGGTSVYSAGEYVYQDYVMDDWGADDGQDAARTEHTDALASAEPRTYRAEALAQAAGEQFGIEANETVAATAEYGDAAQPAGVKDHADIAEVRVAADAGRIHVLVRTTGMIRPDATAVLVLLDTEEGGRYEGPFVTTGAEYQLLAIGDGVKQVVDRGVALACASTCAGTTAATDPADYVNAVEISFDRAMFGAPLPDPLRIGVATALSEDGSTLARVRQGDARSDLINVAFRFDEPARIWMDHDQALALRDGNIDAFVTPIALSRLESGYTERFEPRPGYFERIYVSDSPVNREVESNAYFQGAFQHYGVYIPTGYRPGRPTPATWWTHYRGGHAHDAAAWVPGLLRQLGEQRGNIIISPGARGTSSWYVGRGHEDFLEVWDDSMSSFSIDPDRVYMSGYSMGGWASWFLGMVYPDRFAAAFPTAGPPAIGLWPGVGDPSSPQQGSNPPAQFTFPLIENARNLPYVIFHGTNDELVPSSGIVRMATRFTELGYRHRLYLFPGAEHYTNAILDDWTEAAAYMNGFRRDADPARVTYKVMPANELWAEKMSTPAGTTLDYAFDGAYWVDGLATRSGALDDPKTIGSIDATTFGRGVEDVLELPEAGTGGQTTAYVMTGLRWMHERFTAPENRFEVTLSNIRTATLDVERMALSTAQPIQATLVSDGLSEIRLTGSWSESPNVTGADSSFDGNTLTIVLGAGKHLVTISP